MSFSPVTKLVAGTGVTLSPTNGIGIVTISLGGGGGGGAPPGGIPFGAPSGGGFNYDTSDLLFDNTNKTLWLGQAGNYNPSTPLRISCVSNVDNSSILLDLADDQAIVKTGGALHISAQGGFGVSLASSGTGPSVLALQSGTSGSAVLSAGGHAVLTSDAKQNAILANPTSQLSTATDGFAYMNGLSGVPTGTPTRPFGADTYAYCFQGPAKTLWIHDGTSWNGTVLGTSFTPGYIAFGAATGGGLTEDSSLTYSSSILTAPTVNANEFSAPSGAVIVGTRSSSTLEFIVASSIAGGFTPSGIPFFSSFAGPGMIVSTGGSGILGIDKVATPLLATSDANFPDGIDLGALSPGILQITVSGGVATVSTTTVAAGLNQLTGDVTAGPGTGSQVATIAKISSLTSAGFVKTTSGGILSVDTNTYLTTAAAASTYLTISTAASTYETQSAAASTYLTISTAASTYETQANAASTYLTITTAASTYQPILSLTTKDVLFATGAHAVGQDSSFQYDTSTTQLLVPWVKTPLLYDDTAGILVKGHAPGGFSKFGDDDGDVVIQANISGSGPSLTLGASGSIAFGGLSGPGFLTINGGGTVSVDTSTYLTTASAASTYETIANAASTYQPKATSLAATQIVYGTSSTAISSDAQLTYSSGSLTIGNGTGAGQLTLNAFGSLSVINSIGTLVVKTSGTTRFAVNGSTGDVTVSNLSNGLVKATSGVLSIATAGTDYATPPSGLASTQLVYGTSSTATSSDTQLTYSSGQLTVGDGSGSAQLNLAQFGGGGNVNANGDLFLKANAGTSNTNAVRVDAGNGTDLIFAKQDQVDLIANSSTANIGMFSNGTSGFGGGQNIMFIGNATTAPTANPSGGIYMWIDATSGFIKYRDAAGTIHTLT